jgi:hypothetical protein
MNFCEKSISFSSLLCETICTRRNIAGTNTKDATHHLLWTAITRFNRWLFVVVRDFSLSRLYRCRSSLPGCGATSLGDRCAFFESIMSSSRVECLHWTFRSLKVSPPFCFTTPGTNHPVTLPHTRLTGTLSCCLNWTDERIAIPVQPTFTYVQSLNDGDASLGDFVIVWTSTCTNLASMVYYAPKYEERRPIRCNN